MIDFILNTLLETWKVLGEMSVYLLFGFFMAGVLYILISPENVEKHLGGKGILPVIKASIFGVPLPLCSCGVIPVSASLRKNGASKAAVTSFLLSTPQTGVDSIMVTYSLLGPVFAIYRPIIAFLSGLIGGGIVSLIETEKEAGNREIHDDVICKADSCSLARIKARQSILDKIKISLKYGFVTLPSDIGKTMLVGILIAGVISAIVPDNYFSNLFKSDFLTMIVMMLVGIPVYVCATASVPIAAALILKGISPGAALVFLMTGPATNAATIATIWKIMGRRIAVIYLCTVAVLSLLAGLLLNYIFSFTTFRAGSSMTHSMIPQSVMDASAIVLVLVLLYGILHDKIKLHTKNASRDNVEDSNEEAIVKISGMTCTHCVNAITKALNSLDEVGFISVNLETGIARIKGRSLDKEVIKNEIESLGYKVEGVEILRRDASDMLMVKIKGMTCSHCAMSVKKGLERIPYVENVAVDIDKGEARIEGGNIDNELIKKEVRELGYEVIAISKADK